MNGPTGSKHHEKDCGFVKDKDNAYRLTEESFESGKNEPCQICRVEICYTLDIKIRGGFTMEDYIGKVCPFCKTDIKEGEAVKVCPACGVPHHASCWEENKGCTTFGCSEQHNETQEAAPTDVCSNCGATLGDDQLFCPKCGTPKAEVKKNVCSKCGAELQEGQEFCSKCGQKVGLVVDTGVNSAGSQFNAGVNKANEKKKPIIIGVVAIVIAVIVFSFLKFGGTLFQSNEEKLAIDAAEAVQEILLSPNSIHIMSVYVSEEIPRPEDDDDGIWTNRKVFIYYSATNKGGGITDRNACVWFSNDGTYSVYTEHSDTEIEYADDDEALFYRLENHMIPSSSEYSSWTEIDADKVEQAVLNG